MEIALFLSNRLSPPLPSGGALWHVNPLFPPQLSHPLLFCSSSSLLAPPQHTRKPAAADRTTRTILRAAPASRTPFAARFSCPPAICLISVCASCWNSTPVGS